MGIVSIVLTVAEMIVVYLVVHAIFSRLRKKKPEPQSDPGKAKKLFSGKAIAEWITIIILWTIVFGLLRPITVSIVSSFM